jgi:2-C-methyl-D-erythritol 4-phosphate cytidylyltransferase
MERAGHAPLLVPGSAANFKITYPDDLALAEAVLARESSADVADAVRPRTATFLPPR